MLKKSWSYLSKNDIVDIIAPASQSPLEKLLDGIKWVESIGLIPRVPEDIIKTDLFFASSLESQLTHITNALYSDAKAIWCLRGGYGSMRLIPHLKKLRPPKKPKLFIGFSDITALHLYFSQDWKWPVIHGRTISQMNPNLKNTPDRKFLTDVIFGRKSEKTFKRLRPLNDAAREKKLIQGSITGGNLRIIQSSLGTDWELKAKGKILFIEDVGERGYSVDRMLEQLLQAKLIDRGVKAMVFGDFTEGQEKDGKDLTSEAIERFAKKVNYPVLRGLPAGHKTELNYPIPFNTPSELKLGRMAELTCHYGGRL
jgi:muramoyltetrapeptide carboxypeptidase